MGSGKKSCKSYQIAKARTAEGKKICVETGEEMGECKEPVSAEEMILAKLVEGIIAPAVAVAVGVKKEEKRSQKQA